MQLENRRQLDAINEEMITFQADFENDRSRSMSWPGASILQLKRGCKVMLVWNKSDDLKNGTLGIFTGVKGNDLLVNFKEVGIVEIGRETWITRDRNGQRIGSVTVSYRARLCMHLPQVTRAHFAICSRPLL